MKNERLKSACGKLSYCMILIFSILTNSCEKSVFDYRHKYVGEWNFKTIGYYWSMSPYPTGWTFQDTTYYSGEISYGDDKSELNINYKSGENVIVSIDKEGVIDGTHEKSGQFDDKEHITLILSSPQSMIGGGYTKTITGWK
ncbi:MAG TPA: hypothetical protein PKN44_08145 [Bacteroidales bacterium]|nr:hypothetical protein [Bacteroidales bacterium]HPS49571.1 hypothetical protein [Bacteroidales bacterium]